MSNPRRALDSKGMWRLRVFCEISREEGTGWSLRLCGRSRDGSSSSPEPGFSVLENPSATTPWRHHSQSQPASAEGPGVLFTRLACSGFPNMI